MGVREGFGAAVGDAAVGRNGLHELGEPLIHGAFHVEGRMKCGS